MSSIPVLLVFLATTFNGLLAIANAHGLRQSQATVIVVEVAIVASALVYALFRFRPSMQRWMIFLAVILSIALLRGLVTGTPNVKYLRDILIIPTFVLLGMSCDRKTVLRGVCILHACVLGIAIFEAWSPSGYGALFGVQDYYINTRGYDDTNFWNKESDLFVNASRPQQRIFLPMLDLHREASVFLEPVSLGNYCVIITAFLCGFYREMGRYAKAFLSAGTMFLIIACDGRVAFVTSLGLIALSLIAPRLPARASMLTAPLVIIGAFVVVGIGSFVAGGDDLGGRLATTVGLLTKFGMSDYFGVSDELIGQAADFGIAYLILTQSILGAIFIWLFLAIASREASAPQRRFNHAVAFYLSTALMVSFSVFTIKTAALLWFAFGVLQQSGQTVAEPGRARVAGRRRAFAQATSVALRRP